MNISPEYSCGNGTYRFFFNLSRRPKEVSALSILMRKNNTYGETTQTGPYSVRCRQRSTMFMSSTSELVDDGTLWPMGQHVNWNSCTVFGGAFTPAISSVRDTICCEKLLIFYLLYLLPLPSENCSIQRRHSLQFFTNNIHLIGVYSLIERLDVVINQLGI